MDGRPGALRRAGVAFVAGIAWAAAASVGGAAGLQNPVPATDASIAEGERLFNRRCAACHGADASGGPPKEDFTPAASNLIDETWDHGSTDDEIFAVIRDGIPPDLLMEPWGDRLDETEIWHVVNYIRHLADQD